MATASEYWDRIRQANRAADNGEPEALQSLCDELAALHAAPVHKPGPPPAARLEMTAPVKITPETADHVPPTPATVAKTPHKGK